MRRLACAARWLWRPEPPLPLAAHFVMTGLIAFGAVTPYLW